MQTETRAINLRRAQRKNRRPARGRQLSHDTFEVSGPHGRTVVQVDGDTINWAEQRWISEDMLKRLEHSRNQEKRAPLGDSHGAWQKVAEIPLSMIYDKLPPGGWSDPEAVDKAMRGILNDSDYRLFRADGTHRRL
jgi:hypothetical protein